MEKEIYKMKWTHVWKIKESDLLIMHVMDLKKIITNNC